ncbi:MAG: hypothetical protein U5K79_14325 [Cyclobacteriaceae bacterium]|nr:hypothetical protein [Cyclobacteriaceae bacterium]
MEKETGYIFRMEPETTQVSTSPLPTEAMVSTGQIVVFEGVVSLDKDFGYGYKYDLIIEKATQQSPKPEVKVN